MQIRNPFVAVFGGRPEAIFGRENIISNFEQALYNEGSPYRALFITGRRGTGKTTLLTKLALDAMNAGWRTLDILSLNAADTMLMQLAPALEVTDTTNPQVGVQIMGNGINASGKSHSVTKRYSVEMLPDLLIAACEEEPCGVCIALDEIQKISLDDMAIICSSVQKASRYGHNIILVAAGLPGSYEHFSETDRSNTTYIQRACSEEIGLLARDEIVSGYYRILSTIKEINISRSLIEDMAAGSYGFPYLVQLIGYHLIERINNQMDISQERFNKRHPYQVSEEDVQLAIQKSKALHIQSVVIPAIKKFRGNTISYLKAMAQSFDQDTGIIKTRDVCDIMGKTAKQLSPIRQRLIDADLIFSPATGTLCFAMPYLREHIAGIKEKEITSANKAAMLWKL